MHLACSISMSKYDMLQPELAGLGIRVRGRDLGTLGSRKHQRFLE